MTTPMRSSPLRSPLRRIAVVVLGLSMAVVAPSLARADRPHGHHRHYRHHRGHWQGRGVYLAPRFYGPPVVYAPPVVYPAPYYVAAPPVYVAPPPVVAYPAYRYSRPRVGISLGFGWIWD